MVHVLTVLNKKARSRGFTVLPRVGCRVRMSTGMDGRRKIQENAGSGILVQASSVLREETPGSLRRRLVVGRGSDKMHIFILHGALQSWLVLGSGVQEEW